MNDRDRLAALLEHTQDVVTVLDGDGRIRYASPSAERVLGYDPGSLVGEDAFECIPSEDRGEARATFDRAVETGESDEVQHRYRTADGDRVWLESVVSGERDDALDGYVVTVRDVSERRRAERKRRLTRERLRELTDNADDVLWMFSADWGELLFVNDAYEDVYGRPVEEVRREPTDFLSAIHPDDRERVRGTMERLSAGETVDTEYRVNPGENYGRWVWVKGVPITEDGRVVRIVGFSRDVTERVEYRRQLQVMDRVLRHNLHNDMNVVLGYAEQAHAEGDEAVRNDLERTIERGRQLLATVAKQRELVELLDPTSTTEVVDLAAVARTVVDAVDASYPDATVERDLPESAPVEAIPQVDHAVEELVENAVKHGDADVSVSVRENGEDAVLEVADRGPGIPDQEIRVLTDKQDVEPLYHGSGMGLWLVSWVVRRSGGDLSFEPNEPSGSRVTVRLARAGR